MTMMQRNVDHMDWRVIVIGALLMIGYVVNLVKLLMSIMDPLTGMFVVRCLGVFVPPIGSLVGYF